MVGRQPIGMAAENFPATVRLASLSRAPRKRTRRRGPSLPALLKPSEPRTAYLKSCTVDNHLGLLIALRSRHDHRRRRALTAESPPIASTPHKEELPMLPTFIIAGAGKAGTTSLYNYIGQHPNVDLSSIKEPCFFTQEKRRPELRPKSNAAIGRWSLGLQWYESLFAHAFPSNARGEASPYLGREDAPYLIHGVLPNVKFIFILRHPVERIVSQYWQNVKAARPMPPLEEGIQRNDPRLRRAIKDSAYGENLEPFYELFSTGQILVLLFDDLISTPLQLLNDVFSHIGVDPSFQPSGPVQPHNVRAAPRFSSIQRASRPVADAIRSTPLPMPVRNSLLKAGRTLRTANLTTPRQTQISAQTYAQLLERLEPDIKYVENLTGRDLSSWRH